MDERVYYGDQVRLWTVSAYVSDGKGGYIGVHRKNNMCCIPPVDPKYLFWYHPSTFTITTTSSSGSGGFTQARKPVMLGEKFWLLDESGLVWAHLGYPTGLIGPRERSLDGSYRVSFHKSDTNEAVRYGATGLSIVLTSDSHSTESKEPGGGVKLTNFKKSTSKTLGGYLSAGTGTAITVEIHRPSQILYLGLDPAPLSPTPLKRIFKWGEFVNIGTVPKGSSVVLRVTDEGTCRISRDSLALELLSEGEKKDGGGTKQGRNFFPVHYPDGQTSQLEIHWRCMKASNGQKGKKGPKSKQGAQMGFFGLLALSAFYVFYGWFSNTPFSSWTLGSFLLAVAAAYQLGALPQEATPQAPPPTTTTVDLEGVAEYNFFLAPFPPQKREKKLLHLAEDAENSDDEDESLETTSNLNLLPVSPSFIAVNTHVRSPRLEHAYEASDENSAFLYQILEGIKTCAQSYNTAHFEKYQIDAITKNSTDLELKNYFPQIFRDIRKRHGISTKDYIASWDFKHDNLPNLDTGAGRSGSLFLWSTDKKFLLKTIPSHEAQTLVDILKDYHKHLIDHPESRLMRFVAFHRLKRKRMSSYVHVIVAVNILYSNHGFIMHQKFDLKGRKPKRPLEERPKHAARGLIWKDNQLSRVFWPDVHLRSVLLGAIEHDVAFLMAHDIIDYSLLVGVHDLTRPNVEVKTEEGEKETTPRARSVTSTEESRKYPTTPSTWAGGHFKEEVKIQLSGPAVASIGKRKEIYHVGIIDFLSRYYLKKKTAHFFKSALWDDDTLSTVPPEFYANRFKTYLPTIFPESLRQSSTEYSHSRSISSHSRSRLASPSRVGQTSNSHLSVGGSSSSLTSPSTGGSISTPGSSGGNGSAGGGRKPVTASEV